MIMINNNNKIIHYDITKTDDWWRYCDSYAP